jgi:non-ribosomal peptide synthetase component F
MVVSSSTRKLIEGTPWSRRHFYLGLDLTIYFLATCMTNLCDLAKDHTRLCADGREFSYGEGASLHIIPARQSMAPAKFIQEHKITAWLSVPSSADLMAHMGLLKPGAFPSLRQTFFCGEQLLSSIAEAWQSAAPMSMVSNMYSPTEATVMCLGEDYRPGCALT